MKIVLNIGNFKLRDLYEKSRAVQKPNISECTCPDDGITAFLTPLIPFDVSEMSPRFKLMIYARSLQSKTGVITYNIL
jgi:hypothetical protein